MPPRVRRYAHPSGALDRRWLGVGQASAPDAGQGFLFARPAEAAAVEALLDGRVVPLAAANLRGAA
jgi:hypothetical protein